MLKRAMVVLATVAAALALTAAPASADRVAGFMSLYQQSDRGGQDQHVAETDITTMCTPVSSTILPSGAFSAESGLVTKSVDLFSDSGCGTGTLVDTLDPGETINSFANPVVAYKLAA